MKEMAPRCKKNTESCTAALAGILAACFLLAGCAGKFPLPGGSESSNVKWYDSREDMETRLAKLYIGMPEEEVFATLGHGKDEMIRLDRREARIALLGGENVPMPDDMAAHDYELMQAIEGYKFTYKKVKRNHGFTSIIRIRTDEAGFRYSVSLIFYNGVLFEKPIISGGIVTEDDSKTLFDYLNPGVIMDQAVN